MYANEPVAVVTGASRGIGRAIAQVLSQSGYRLVLAARDAVALQKLAAGLPRACQIVPVDFREAEAGRLPIIAALQAFGRIDVLVNNAGIAPRQALAEASTAILDELYAVNMRTLHVACRAAWPSLCESRGVIVNVSSLAASDPFPGFQLYGASKAWVNLYTQAIASEGRPLGIRAFALGLGAVATDLLQGLFPDFPEDQTLSTDAVAKAVLALLDPALAPASGTCIRLCV